MTEHSQETKIAVLEAKVDHLIGHVKELTQRVRANEKVVASVSLLGVIACTIIGAGYFAPKAEACSLPIDGSPANCGPPDVVCLGIETCPNGPIVTPLAKETKTPDYYSNRVTLYDTRIAHMGHPIPTGEWIQKVREYEERKIRTPIDEMINDSLLEYEEGHVQEE